MPTKGKNKAFYRKLVRAREKNSQVTRAGMLGRKCRYNWGDGVVYDRKECLE